MTREELLNEMSNEKTSIATKPLSYIHSQDTSIKEATHWRQDKADSKGAQTLCKHSESCREFIKFRPSGVLPFHETVVKAVFAYMCQPTSNARMKQSVPEVNLFPVAPTDFNPTPWISSVHKVSCNQGARANILWHDPSSQL